jgi:hypothetical protein
MNNEKIDFNFKNMLIEIYYDEVEHLSQFKTLLLAVSYGALLA